MSVRFLQTFVIDCDSCDAVFADVVDVSIANARGAAIRNGWTENEEGTAHKCPACAEGDSMVDRSARERYARLAANAKAKGA